LINEENNNNVKNKQYNRIICYVEEYSEDPWPKITYSHLEILHTRVLIELIVKWSI